MSLYLLNNYKRFYKGFWGFGDLEISEDLRLNMFGKSLQMEIWGLFRRTFTWRFEGVETLWKQANMDTKWLGAWHVWRNLTCGNVRPWRSVPVHYNSHDQKFEGNRVCLSEIAVYVKMICEGAWHIWMQFIHEKSKGNICSKSRRTTSPIWFMASSNLDI